MFGFFSNIFERLSLLWKKLTKYSAGETLPVETNELDFTDDDNSCNSFIF